MNKDLISTKVLEADYQVSILIILFNLCFYIVDQNTNGILMFCKGRVEH